MHNLPYVIGIPLISDEFTEGFLLSGVVRYHGRTCRDTAILPVQRHTDVLVFQDESVTHRLRFHR